MKSLKPVPKVTARAAGGAADIVLVWILSLLGVSVPSEVS